MSIDERPRFLTLRRESGLTSEQVAQKAGLSLSDEYRAEIGSAMEPEVAERILEAFSSLTGKAWTMRETAINVQRERR
jgi:transcriptional regulator with XRE-family HTH domain